tara:strand:+ start:650 stop:1330 length:681 start_codon:yes stop_codon:yes gene_type:complete
MDKIVIFGTGDFSSLAHFYFNEDTEHEVVAFTMNKEWITEDSFEDKPVIAFGDILKLYPPNEYKLFAPMSFKQMNDNRKKIFNKGKELGYTFATYISSKSTVWSNNKIGENCFITEHNAINPFVEIGNNCVLWNSNHIGHHTKIKDHVFITSQVVICGQCVIGNNSFFGVNSSLRDETTVEDYTLVGMGANIVKDTKKGDVWIGAKSSPKNYKSWELDSISHKSKG